MPDPTLENAIRENAAGPAKASGDAGSVEQHPLTDQIAAERHLAAKRASKIGLGIKLTRVIPPGA